MLDFQLPDQDRKQRSLKEFQGKKIVLAFFPGAFTGGMYQRNVHIQGFSGKLAGAGCCG